MRLASETKRRKRVSGAALVPKISIPYSLLCVCFYKYHSAARLPSGSQENRERFYRPLNGGDLVLSPSGWSISVKVTIIEVQLAVPCTQWSRAVLLDPSAAAVEDKSPEMPRAMFTVSKFGEGRLYLQARYLTWDHFRLPTSQG
jgi:hypothetical protein